MIKLESFSNWAVVFLILSSTLCSVEGEFLFFASTLVGDKVYIFSTCFLIGKHSQALTGLYTAHYKGKYIAITKFFLAIVEMLFIYYALGHIDIQKLYDDMFKDANIPPKYNEHMKTVTVVYLIYSFIFRLLEVFSTLLISFSDDFQRTPDSDGAQANSTRASSLIPIANDIHNHRREQSSGNSRHKSPKSSDYHQMMITKPTERSQNKYELPAHLISNSKPGTTDTIITGSVKSPSQGRTEGRSGVFSNPYATVGTHKVGSFRQT